MKSLRFGAAFAVALALAGCGGTTAISPLQNIYRGNYTGTWTSLTMADSGTLTVAVAGNGSITGTMTTTTLTLTGNVVGNMDDTGHFTMIGGFGANGNFTMVGNVVLNGVNLDGVYTTTLLSTDYASTMTLTPTSGP